MVRWLGVLCVVGGLSLGACSHSEKTTTTPAWTAAPDSQALVGTWGDGSSNVNFDGNGNYRWDRTRACGNPPCPTTSESGTYTVNAGKLYLRPSGGTEEVVEFSWGDQQRAVALHSNKDSASWNLTKH